MDSIELLQHVHNPGALLMQHEESSNYVPTNAQTVPNPQPLQQSSGPTNIHLLPKTSKITTETNDTENKSTTDDIKLSDDTINDIDINNRTFAIFIKRTHHHDYDNRMEHNKRRKTMKTNNNTSTGTNNNPTQKPYVHDQ